MIEKMCKIVLTVMKYFKQSDVPKENKARDTLET